MDYFLIRGILQYMTRNELWNMCETNDELSIVAYDILLERYKTLVHESWLPIIREEITKPHFRKIDEYAHVEIAMRCFSTPLDSIRVVVPGEMLTLKSTDGYCFSRKDTPSGASCANNIISAACADVGIEKPKLATLAKWSTNGVLLLNKTIYLEPSSNKCTLEWCTFTDNIIKQVVAHTKHCVFMLWGRDAKDCKLLITPNHCILEWVHPAPIIRGNFIECRHFSKANTYLISHGRKPVDWSL